MITGKQRAYLRKMAHQLEPIFQIGKEGVTDAFIDLTKHLQNVKF